MSLEANLDAIRASNRAIAVHDAETILQSLPPEFKLNVVLQPQALMSQGYIIDCAALREKLSLLFDILPDCTIQELDARHSAKSIYLNLMLSGTHRGAMILPTGASILPSCAPVQIPIEVYSLFDASGVLVGSTCYVSLSDVLKQAGISEEFLQS